MRLLLKQEDSKLANICMGAPSNNDSKCKLGRMMKGWRPDRNVMFWSGGLSTSIKIPPVNLEGSLPSHA